VIDLEAVESLLALSDGDARCALNGLEFIVNAKLAAAAADASNCRQVVIGDAWTGFRDELTSSARYDTNRPARHWNTRTPILSAALATSIVQRAFISVIPCHLS